MRVVVNVAGRGYWLWNHPGGERDLRRAWSDGRAPMHLLDGDVRPFDGALERVLRTPADPDAIVDIDEGEAILYVGDDAVPWSSRELAAESSAVAREEEALLVAVNGHTWRFPGSLDELEGELDDGRFPADLGPGWRGRPARYVGTIAEGAPSDPRVSIALLGPDAARFSIDGRRRDWHGAVERVEEEISLAQLAARAPFEVEMARHRIVGLTAGPESDVEALELLLGHPESSLLERIDLGALAGPTHRILAAILALPRPALTTLTLPWTPSAEDASRLSRTAPALRQR